MSLIGVPGAALRKPPTYKRPPEIRRPQKPYCPTSLHGNSDTRPQHSHAAGGRAASYPAPEDAILARFLSMRKALQMLDKDGSGTLTMPEIQRALAMWAVPTPLTLASLFTQCEANGKVEYHSFVDALARDAVGRAASHTPAAAATPRSGRPRTQRALSVRSSAAHMAGEGSLAWAAEKVNERYGDMHRAFQFADLDKSGTLDRAELARALEVWQVRRPSDVSPEYARV